MTEDKNKDQENAENVRKEHDWPLPNCTKAAAAEHARAADEDEPCNDARGAVSEEKKAKD